MEKFFKNANAYADFIMSKQPKKNLARICICYLAVFLQNWYER